VNAGGATTAATAAQTSSASAKCFRQTISSCHRTPSSVTVWLINPKANPNIISVNQRQSAVKNPCPSVFVPYRRRRGHETLTISALFVFSAVKSSRFVSPPIPSFLETSLANTARAAEIARRRTSQNGLIGAEGLLPGAKNRDQSVPSRNYAVGRDAIVPQIFAHDEERAARISDSDLQVASNDALAQEDQTGALDPIVWLRHKQMGLMFLGIGSHQYRQRPERITLDRVPGK
jgi:hypothetical protein